MALTSYQAQTQRLLHDPGAQAYSLADITVYINIARSQIAIEGECIRALLSGGTITNLQILSPGSGYSGTATVAFTGGGAQSFATATIGGGAISSVTLVNGGWGWIPASNLVVTATGSTGGSNATFTSTVDNSATTVTGQEVLQFSTLNNLLAAWNSSTNPPTQGAVIGGSQVIKVFSVACNQVGTYKPMLTQKIWSEFQAYLRIYANTQQNYPVYWSQYAQGVNGSLYLFPWPAQALQMDVDVCVTPINLVTDSTAEAIPYPWTDAIPYYAAYLAYENSSRKEDADRMFKMYQMFMARGRANSESPFMPDYYNYEY
jgi:hypothetical protein